MKRNKKRIKKTIQERKTQIEARIYIFLKGIETFFYTSFFSQKEETYE